MSFCRLSMTLLLGSWLVLFVCTLSLDSELLVGPWPLAAALLLGALWLGRPNAALPSALVAEPVAAVAAPQARDPLTGLGGRAVLEAAIAAARRRPDQRHAAGLTAFMLVDLDGMREINAHYGYLAGDEVVRGVGRRLDELADADTVVARLAGDHFALLLAGLRDQGAVREHAYRLMQRLGEEHRYGAHLLRVTSSIGIALAPAHGTSFEQLVRAAELALSEAKRNGGRRWRIFDTGLDTQLQMHRSLERELKQALESGQFELHFQPQIELRTGRVLACEALLRWRHPERGLIPPGNFIPVAESSGLIRPIGAWVMAEACRAAQRWRAAGFEVGVAVNVSTAQLRQAGFASRVARTLEETGLPAHCLELEVTESLFVDPTQTIVRRTLADLAAAGLSLAIDDFGTGYSSLAYLKRLPVSKIKIDKSFLRDVGKVTEDEAIIRAIIALARTLGRRILAEGVETEEQSLFLRREGCDEVQGFLFARPLPEQACLAFLDSRQAPPLLRAVGC
jgi:diguanylate cyclase (GGDEF)-like protein